MIRYDWQPAQYLIRGYSESDWAGCKKSGKSAHDLLDDPKLSRDVGEEFQGLEESDQKGDTTGEDQLMSIREKLKKPKNQFKSDHAPSPPQRKPEKGGYRSGHLQIPVVFALRRIL